MHFDELSEEKIEREELAVEHEKSLSEHIFLEVYQENDRCKKFVLSWLVVHMGCCQACPIIAKHSRSQVRKLLKR